jgi:hypothetical protein
MPKLQMKRKKKRVTNERLWVKTGQAKIEDEIKKIKL